MNIKGPFLFGKLNKRVRIVAESSNYVSSRKVTPLVMKYTFAQ